MLLTRARFFVAQGCLAFLPALLVLLVAQDEPAKAANLSVVLGVVGATFSIAYFGQRAFVTLRGHTTLSARQALSFRTAMAVLAMVVTVAMTYSLGLALQVGLFAAALKSSEAVIDLLVGIWIRHRSQTSASQRFLIVAAVRAVLVAVPLLIIGASQAIEHPLAMLYLLMLGLVTFGLAHRDTALLDERGSYRVHVRDLVSYGWELRSFVASTAACAVLSALPRVLLPWVTAQSYTAPALALSCVPIFALGFQAIWLANLKRLAENSRRHTVSFAVEIVLLLGLAAMAFPLWEWAAGIAYGLVSAPEQFAFAVTLTAALVYFAAMTSANLFKATTSPFNEAVTYILGSCVLAAGVTIAKLSIDLAMVASAIVMLIYVVVGMVTLTRTRVAGLARSPVGNESRAL